MTEDEALLEYFRARARWHRIHAQELMHDVEPGQPFYEQRRLDAATHRAEARGLDLAADELDHVDVAPVDRRLAALARLLAGVDAWDADLLEPKVDLQRARDVDQELQAAREHAARVLERGA